MAGVSSLKKKKAKGKAAAAAYQIINGGIGGNGAYQRIDGVMPATNHKTDVNMAIIVTRKARSVFSVMASS